MKIQDCPNLKKLSIRNLNIVKEVIFIKNPKFNSLILKEYGYNFAKLVIDSVSC